MAKKFTINDLAAMVQKGFEETATKDDLKALRKEVNDGFGHLHNVILDVHERRLDRLEGKVGRLEAKVK